MSPNGEFYAGLCEGESDIGNPDTSCALEENQYCLKLKITLSPELKQKTELYENTLSDFDLLKETFSKEKAEEMQTFLAERELYEAIFNKNFQYNSTKNVINL